MEYEGEGDTNCSRCIWNDLQRIGKGNGRLRNQRTSRDHPAYRITTIGQNTEKSPGDFSRLDVIQSPVTKLSANVRVKNSQIIIRIIIFYSCRQMHESESVKENETHKILWDFEIHTYQQIPTRSINKKKKKRKKKEKGTCCLVDFAVPADHIRKIKAKSWTWILTENWKSYETLRGCWYQL